MKNILSFLLFTISSLLFSQNREELNYYPLHVGDIWQYKITYHSINYQSNTFYMLTKVLKDTILDSGFKYFIIEQPKFVFWKFSSSEVVYTRIDTTNGVVYERSSADSFDVIQDSLFCTNGSLNGNEYFAQTDETTLFGDTRKIRRLTSPISSQGIDKYIFYVMEIGVYLKGISYSWISSEGNSYDLVYAKINGKEYGTYVSVADKDQLPTQFSLSQNYPNPFNPETTIEYSIPKSEYVTLKIYDLLGREVATLVDEFKQAGNYNSQFSIRNFQLTSGVYFYRLQAGSYSQTKKLIILK